MFRAKNPPNAIFSYYLKAAASSSAKIQVVDANGTVVRELEGPSEAGIHRVAWDLRKLAPPPPSAADPFGGGTPAPGDRVAPGSYVVKLMVNGRTAVAPLNVLSDPNR